MVLTILGTSIVITLCGQKEYFVLAYALPLLVSEHDYWTAEPKQVTVATASGSYSLSRFYADWFAPRPESYL